MKYEIWEEGYCAQGGSSPARKLGEGNGDTFEEAVVDWVCKNPIKAASHDLHMTLQKSYLDYNKYTNPVKVTFWGCRVFPTEAEARESYG